MEKYSKEHVASLLEPLMRLSERWQKRAFVSEAFLLSIVNSLFVPRKKILKYLQEKSLEENHFPQKEFHFSEITPEFLRAMGFEKGRDPFTGKFLWSLGKYQIPHLGGNGTKYYYNEEKREISYSPLNYKRECRSNYDVLAFVTFFENGNS